MRNYQKLVWMLFFAFAISFSTLQAQYYKHGLGLRLGNSYGLTYKHGFSDKVALEAILATRYYGGYNYHNGRKDGWWKRSGGDGFTLGALIEYHLPIKDVSGLNWYFGAGAHIGSWRSYYDYDNWYNDRAYFIFGLDVILGIEYSFKEVPICLALDYKPAFNIIGYPRLWPDDVAFSIRVLLDKL